MHNNRLSNPSGEPQQYVGYIVRIWCRYGLYSWYIRALPGPCVCDLKQPQVKLQRIPATKSQNSPFWQKQPPQVKIATPSPKQPQRVHDFPSMVMHMPPLLLQSTVDSAALASASLSEACGGEDCLAWSSSLPSDAQWIVGWLYGHV